jgi:hypothetical protein
MANFNIKVPEKNYSALANFIQSNAQTKLAALKTSYGTIVDEVAANSNVPAELLYSFMMILSNGVNEPAFQSADGQIRSGLFSLSNKVGKEVLTRELAKGRMNAAEKEFLNNAGDANLKLFIGDDYPPGVKSGNKFWKNAKSAFPTSISATSKQNPINWMNAKVAIQVGALWIGQVWDEISQYTKKPLDKVIITIAMPYGSYIQKGTNNFIYERTGYMSGSSIITHRPYNTDYTTTTQKSTKSGTKEIKNTVWLGGGSGIEDKTWEQGHIMGGNPVTRVHPKGGQDIVNPRGGNVHWAMKIVMAPGGVLDRLTV